MLPAVNDNFSPAFDTAEVAASDKDPRDIAAHRGNNGPAGGVGPLRDKGLGAQVD